MKKKIYSLAALIIIATAALLIKNKKSMDDELRFVGQLHPDIPVYVDTVRLKNISDELVLTGICNPFNAVTVSSEAQAKVTEVKTEVGKAVSRGQTLAILDNEVLEAQLLNEKANYEKSMADMRRYEALAKKDAASEQQYEIYSQAARNAKTNLAVIQKNYNNSIITAPQAGVITKKMIEKGSLLLPGTAIFEITNISRIKFTAYATHDELPNIKNAKSISIRFDAIPGEVFAGKVTSVNVIPDNAQRYSVEILISNKKKFGDEYQILPGMFGYLTVSGLKDIKRLAISRKALTGTLKDPRVFILEGNRVHERAVQIEKSLDDYVFVSGGIKAGECVVVSGQINLKDGMNVHVAR